MGEGVCGWSETHENNSYKVFLFQSLYMRTLSFVTTVGPGSAQNPLACSLFLITGKNGEWGEKRVWDGEREREKER